MNLLQDYGYTQEEIAQLRQNAYDAIFKKDRGFYTETSGNKAYILVEDNAISSMAMGFSLMLCVQKKDKDMFDKLWQFLKDYMQLQQGEQEGLFCVSVEPTGAMIDKNVNPLSQQYIAASLTFAASVWQEGAYAEEALTVLRACLHSRKPLWDNATHLSRDAEDNVELDLNAPQFAALFAMFCDPRDADFWKQVADTCVRVIATACDKHTGLCPELVSRNGTPLPHEKGGVYSLKSYSVMLNIAMNALWFGDISDLSEMAARLLKFFYDKEDETLAIYDISGVALSEKSPSIFTLRASVALASLVIERKRGNTPSNLKQMAVKAVKHFCQMSKDNMAKAPLEKFINLFTLLILSGDFRVW